LDWAQFHLGFGVVANGNGGEVFNRKDPASHEATPRLVAKIAQECHEKESDDISCYGQLRSFGTRARLREFRFRVGLRLAWKSWILRHACSCFECLAGLDRLQRCSILSDIYYVSNSFPGDSTSVELEAGSLALNGSSLTVGLYLAGSISQTGLVPAAAESLRFEAEGPGQGGSLGATGFEVTLGGQSLSYSVLSQGPDYVVYGANVLAGMDGQMEALTFGAGDGPVLLDNIEFSTTGVPEPAEWALIGIGVVLFGFWRRWLTAKNA
jgi:hypothetical protein